MQRNGKSTCKPRFGKPMKGGFELYLIIGVLLFVVAIVTIIITLQTYYADFAGYVEIPIENLEVVESAHAVESCLARLSANERFISKDVLEEYKGDSVNRICEIQEPIMWGYVKDMEDGAEYLFPPPSDDMIERAFPHDEFKDFTEAVRRWRNKQIKTEHMIWVSIVVPEVKSIVDEDFDLTGEFLVQATWEGLGSPVKNDIILKLYPKGYYKNVPENIQTIQHYEVRQWLGDMEAKGIKFDSRIANFYHIPVKDIIPHNLVDCKSFRILDLVDSDACVEVFENISEIHMGRLGVKI